MLCYSFHLILHFTPSWILFKEVNRPNCRTSKKLRLVAISCWLIHETKWVDCTFPSLSTMANSVVPQHFISMIGIQLHVHDRSYCHICYFYISTLVRYFGSKRQFFKHLKFNERRRGRQKRPLTDAELIKRCQFAYQERPILHVSIKRNCWLRKILKF